MFYSYRKSGGKSKLYLIVAIIAVIGWIIIGYQGVSIQPKKIVETIEIR